MYRACRVEMSESIHAAAAHFLCEFGAPGTRTSQDTLAPIFSPLDLYTKVGNYFDPDT